MPIGNQFLTLILTIRESESQKRPSDSTVMEHEGLHQHTILSPPQINWIF